MQLVFRNNALSSNIKIKKERSKKLFLPSLLEARQVPAIPPLPLDPEEKVMINYFNSPCSINILQKWIGIKRIIIKKTIFRCEAKFLGLT